MNATEDDQPLGEAPEYVIITAPPRDALTSIPVLGENERQAIAELRWIHKRCNHDHEICDTCDGCEYPWPCNTIGILDKWGV